METNTIEIWMLSAIAAAAISLAIALVIWLSGKKDTTANISDRYKYPKKDCECDCLGECKDKKDGNELYGLTTDYIYTDYTVNTNDMCNASNYANNACLWNIPLEYYMRRGNKMYYRGDGVKVVITVK